ncbi:queuosine precursor transporter [Thalassoroseus pseudoceratinae]|uniref:queuosine precursor transporter n=1 Tax=Thalassoroseus pseudoceratinae TaxID=2713176 RepID=UPI001423C981|nr:queuosine precursor transporter [Thalassoroseus pseudoceratinae]
MTPRTTLHLNRDRSELAFLALAGIFISSMTMLNILGATRILDMSFTLAGLRIPLSVPIGVLPYPITFLCTDLISEVYGRRRATWVVIVGFIANLWLLLIIWLGGVLPGLNSPVEDVAGRLPLFFEIRAATLGGTVGSMIAYLIAQFCDVYLFHFWKDLTDGKHLWLRNNGSTLVSQFLDTFAVLTIAHFYAGILPMDANQPVWPQLWTYIFSGYVFKVVFALLDTLPFYWLTSWLTQWVNTIPESPEAPSFEQVV